MVCPPQIYISFYSTSELLHTSTVRLCCSHAISTACAHQIRNEVPIVCTCIVFSSEIFFMIACRCALDCVGDGRLRFVELDEKPAHHLVLQPIVPGNMLLVVVLTVSAGLGAEPFYNDILVMLVMITDCWSRHFSGCEMTPMARPSNRI